MAKREYTKDWLTVIWQPDMCTHCGDCVAALPAVFDTERRPGVDLNAAPLETIRDQVLRCPSGALSTPNRIPDDV